MKSISMAFAAALVLAAMGCKTHGADCESAIAKGMELSKADMQKHPGMDEKTMQKLKDIGVQRCTEDKWPEAAIKCMVDAKSETEAQACYGKLSPEQQAKMNQAAWGGAAAGGTAGAGSAATGDWGSAGSAMAGSAMAGSAASGSDMGAGSAGSAAAPK
jgi:hypothetical protein